MLDSACYGLAAIEDAKRQVQENIELAVSDNFVTAVLWNYSAIEDALVANHQ